MRTRYNLAYINSSTQYCSYYYKPHFHADHDPLYYLVYERTPVVKDSLEPHMWGYRPRITLEHLVRYMQQQKKKFPILEEFLKNVFCLYYAVKHTSFNCVL